MDIALLSDFPTLAGALIKSMMVSGLQLIAFLGVFVVVGFLIDRMELKRNYWIRSTVGNKGIYATALIGVPVHEMGHALMCVVFGHKVEQIKLVQFGAEDGTMGFVNHSYEPNNMFHRIGLFFIGIAPILMGVLVITLTLFFTLPKTFHKWIEAVSASGEMSDILGTAGVLMTSLFSLENLSNPWFYLFMVLSVSIASHMSLSKSDIVGAGSGLISMYVIAVIFNLVFLSARGGDMGITELFMNEYNVFMLSISLIAILLAGFASVIAFLLFETKKRIFG
jgi:hypothetical protein